MTTLRTGLEATIERIENAFTPNANVVNLTVRALREEQRNPGYLDAGGLEKTLEEFMAESKTPPTILDFSTTWCGPCMTQYHDFAEKAGKHARNAKFGIVVMDTEIVGHAVVQRLSKRFDVRSFPSYAAVQGRTIVKVDQELHAVPSPINPLGSDLRNAMATQQYRQLQREDRTPMIAEQVYRIQYNGGTPTFLYSDYELMRFIERETRIPFPWNPYLECVAKEERAGVERTGTASEIIGAMAEWYWTIKFNPRNAEESGKPQYYRALERYARSLEHTSGILTLDVPVQVGFLGEGTTYLLDGSPLVWLNLIRDRTGVEIAPERGLLTPDLTIGITTSGVPILMAAESIINGTYFRLETTDTVDTSRFTMVVAPEYQKEIRRHSEDPEHAAPAPYLERVEVPTLDHWITSLREGGVAISITPSNKLRVSDERGRNAEITLGNWQGGAEQRYAVRLRESEPPELRLRGAAQDYGTPTRPGRFDVVLTSVEISRARLYRMSVVIPNGTTTENRTLGHIYAGKTVEFPLP